MAAKKDIPSGERSRVRFMLVDFDGPSADLQQIAQTFAHAVKATTPVVVAVPPLPNGPVATIAGPGPQDPKAPTPFDATPEADTIQGEAEEGAAARPLNGAKRKYKCKTPSVIADLDLTNASVPFAAYMQEQAPKEHSKRYLAIMQWLKVHRGITEVGADHAYTCYRFLNLTVPADVTFPFRKMKSQGWVEKGSARGLFKITHVGENQLNRTPAS